MLVIWVGGVDRAKTECELIFSRHENWRRNVKKNNNNNDEMVESNGKTGIKIISNHYSDGSSD